MRGVILAAGQGARLNGGTAGLPKCLVSIGGEALLSRNIRALRAAGLDEIVVVIGCAADAVRQHCAGAICVENDIFTRTNSLYSLWLARPLLTDGFVVMNCDVLAHPQLLSDLLSARHDDALLVGYRDDDTVYGEEEMKVRVSRGRIVDISKALPPEDADGENLGIARFGAAGARVLIDIMDDLVRGGELTAWVPQAFKVLSSRRPLHAIGTRGYPWIEIDFPEDYRRAVDEVLPQIDADSNASPAPAPRQRIARSA